MLIKGVKDKKGIPLTPEEALPHAVAYGTKSKNTRGVVYVTYKDSVKLSGSVQSSKNTDGSWEAKASGTVNIGHVDTHTNRYFKEKPHKFSVHYKESKDVIGVPEISIVSFEMSPISQNPSSHVKHVPAAPATVVAPEKKEEAK